MATGTGGDLNDALFEYISARYAPEDDLLRKVLTTAQQEGFPSIQVSPVLGRLLALLIKISGARRVLEIGTLAGYSTIWMGRALPSNGTLISLEVEPRHAALARRFISEAGLDDRIEIRLGPALETLKHLSGGRHFDMAFIDANKESYPEYLDAVLDLVRPGGLIVADNVLRNGDVLDEEAVAAETKAIQTYNDRVARDPRLEAVVLMTRNGRGLADGVSVARIKADDIETARHYSRE
jgi:predicted O-methyltransferase YrrM